MRVDIATRANASSDLEQVSIRARQPRSMKPDQLGLQACDPTATFALVVVLLEVAAVLAHHAVDGF